MNILKEFYYGNIAEISRTVKFNTKKLNKEEKLYNKLKENLSPEDLKLFKEYLVLYDERLDKFAEEKYINGFKTGLLIGVECGKLKFS